MFARLALIVVIVLALAAALFSAWPLDLPPARALKSSDDAWGLSRAAPLDVDEALSVINEAHLFGLSQTTAAGLGTPAAVVEKALTPPNWRIAGVFSDGGRYLALLATEGEPLQKTLKQGDRLPGGAKILTIHPDSICILLNGKIRSINTYRE